VRLLKRAEDTSWVNVVVRYLVRRARCPATGGIIASSTGKRLTKILRQQMISRVRAFCGVSVPIFLKPAASQNSFAGSVAAQWHWMAICFGHMLDEGEAEVAALGVVADGGLKDRADGWAPSELFPSQQVASGLSILVDHADVSVFEIPIAGDVGQEADGFGIFAGEVVDEFGVVERCEGDGGAWFDHSISLIQLSARQMRRRMLGCRIQTMNSGCECERMQWSLSWLLQKNDTAPGATGAGVDLEGRAGAVDLGL